jgi:hypothetical protein
MMRDDPQICEQKGVCILDHVWIDDLVLLAHEVVHVPIWSNVSSFVPI